MFKFVSKILLLLALLWLPARAVVIQNDIPAPLSLWTFNEDSGNALDAGTENNPCVPQNGAIRALDGDNNAAGLDGIDANWACGSGLDDLSTFTWAAWVKLSTFGEISRGYIITKQQDTTNRTFSANVVGGGSSNEYLAVQLITASNVSRTFDTNANVIDTDVWIHLLNAGTCTSTDTASCTRQTYMNGFAITTSPFGTTGTTYPPSDATWAVTIGNRPALDRAFAGLIDDVTVYGANFNKYQAEWVFRRGRLPLPTVVPPAITETDCSALALEAWTATGGIAADFLQADGTGMWDKTAAQSQEGSGCLPWSPGIPIRQ